MEHFMTLIYRTLVALLLIASAGCGGSFFEEFTFSDADLVGGVDQEDGNLTVGFNFAAYSFEGRLQIGIDSASAELLLCFIALPNDDEPQPICYPISIAAWADSELADPRGDPQTQNNQLLHMLQGVDPLTGSEATRRMAEAEMQDPPG